ncbi:MAG: type II toxin-antitoxin system VapC family toxin [Patescibacteria group bacterium]
MYLIDSDVLINFLKGEKEAVKTINKLQSQPLYISIISVGEILEGLLETKNKKKLTSFKELLKTVTIINIDLSIIERFASIRRSLRQKGLLIDNFDLLIAATCLTHNLILITNDISHFKRILELKILTIK